MKITAIIAILLLPAAITAQVKTNKGFTLKGQLTNAANQMVYLSDRNNTPEKILYKDSTIVDAGGRFLFKGVVVEPGSFTLGLKNGKQSINIYMENADVLLEGNADSLNKVIIKGSREEAIAQEFQRLVATPKEKTTEDHNSAYNAAVASKDTVAIKREKEKLEVRFKKNYIKNFETIVKKYPNSAMAIELIGAVATMQEIHLADSLLKLVELTPAGRLTKAKALRKNLNITLSLAIGSKAPDFQQPDTAGKLISLASMKGKYVLLDFWASWCGPCRAENPHLLQAYEKFKDKGFTILSVSVDASRNSWLKAVKEDNLLWTQVVCDLKAPNEASMLYAVMGIPANFLIDPDGKIVATNLRGGKLEEVLGKLL